MQNYTITPAAWNMMPLDLQFEIYVIKEVKSSKEYHELHFKEGSCFVIKNTGFIPKPNMKVKFYGRGFGYTVRGIIINNTPIFYRTEDEHEQDFQEEQRQNEIKREKDFEKNKLKLDADYDSLPKVYQIRIDWFRKNNPKFRIDFEPYELFCCKESIKIAKALKTPNAIDEWQKLSYDEQIKAVKIDSGHSGNTIGCATLLAKLYCDRPRYVILAHGAMVCLCGCEEYGCLHNQERIQLAEPERSLYDLPYARFLALEIK